VTETAPCSPHTTQVIPLLAERSNTDPSEGSSTGMRLEEELYRQRLETLARIGRHLSHDCRNALASIVYNADTLRERYGEAALDRNLLSACHADIAEAVRRVDDHIGAWCGYTTEGVVDDDPQATTDLQATITRVVALVRRRTARGGHRIEHHISSKGRWLAAPPVIATQVLLSLVDNSLDAATGPTRIRIVSRKIGGPSDLVRLHVSDDGPGIASAVVDRIFEPGFSTRANARGLGLTITRQALKAHGATIELADESPGTTFLITLRAAEPPALHAPCDRSGNGD